MSNARPRLQRQLHNTPLLRHRPPLARLPHEPSVYDYPTPMPEGNTGRLPYGFIPKSRFPARRVESSALCSTLVQKPQFSSSVLRDFLPSRGGLGGGLYRLVNEPQLRFQSQQEVEDRWRHGRFTSTNPASNAYVIESMLHLAFGDTILPASIA
jgi:hypothetical protein